MIIDEKFAWFIGWFASDGHINKKENFISFCLKASDDYILTIFSELYGGKVRYYSYKRQLVSGLVDYPIVQYVLYNKDICNWIMDNDPKNNIPFKESLLQRKFIQGFLEGRGHVSINNKNQFRINFTNESLQLLTKIMIHFKDNLDIDIKNLSLHKDKCYQVNYETRTGRIIAWYLYKDIDPKYLLPRKALIVNKLFSGIDQVSIYVNIILTCKELCVKHNNGIMFRLYQTKDSRQASKMVCKGFHILGIKATPITYGKGKEIYYGVYIPNNQLLVDTQDFLTIVDKFPGKVKLKA